MTVDARVVAAGEDGVWRRVHIGGAIRGELLARLQAAGIGLNPAALALFGDERFTTGTTPSVIETVRRSVASLGWPGGATFAQLLASAASQGLRACEVFRRARAGVRNGADLGAKRSHSSGYGEHLQRRAAPFRAHERVWRNASQALSACPLELGPQLRLQYTDQPEGAIGQPATRHRAPPGAITVASWPLSDDEAVPKGFYLRCIAGVLWLRGYRAPADHVWSPDDVLLFQRPA